MSEEENKAGEYYIYKIYWDDNEDVYVGHTEDMSKRTRSHAKAFLSKPSPTRLLHQAFERNGLDNRKYEILETKWCDSEEEACKLEKVWWKKLESNLNMLSPYRTKEERKIQQQEIGKRRYEEKKEEILTYNRLYHHTHKDSINARQRKYHHQNREIIAQKQKAYRERNEEVLREKRLERYYNNQEERQRQSRAWYQRNKDEINRRRRERARKKREQAPLPSSENL